MKALECTKIFHWFVGWFRVLPSTVGNYARLSDPFQRCGHLTSRFLCPIDSLNIRMVVDREDQYFTVGSEDEGGRYL